MICSRKKAYLVAGVCLVAFVSVLKLSYLQIQKHSLLPKTVTLKGNGVCSGDVAYDSISSLAGNKMLVIGSYFDNRVEKLIRILGIAHHTDSREPYCWFCCPGSAKTYVSKAAMEVHSDRFGFPYAATDLTCLEPAGCEPHYVSLHPFPDGDPGPLQRFEIKNRAPEGSPVDFTVCISALFGGYDNVLQFVQSMEMYKILGMQRVTLYKHSCSRRMERVLEHYVAQGTAEVVPWPIASHLNVSTAWHFTGDGAQIGYYGQIAALNDCVYRNMYRSRYVVLNDADEIILPVRDADWKTMMGSLRERNPESGVFLFENHVFPNTVFAPLPSATGPSWWAVPGVDILRHVLREPDRKEVINPRKMIVNPRAVVQTSVHSVLRAFGGSVKVPMDVAMVHHCRKPLQPRLPRASLIRDTTLWRYNSTLISRVSQVLEEIGL